MKKTILFALFAIISLPLFAQYDDEDEQTFKFGIGTSFSLPVGELKESADYGVGFELTGVYSLSDHLAAFTQLGAHAFKSINDVSLVQIPIIVGAKFKAGGFFAGAGVGYGLYTDGDDKLNGFLYSPQVGYDFGRMHIIAHYTGTAVSGGSLAYFGLKLFRTF